MTSYISTRILLIAAFVLAVASSNSSQEKCQKDAKNSTSFHELTEFIGPQSRILFSFVVNTAKLDFGGYQKSCLAIQDEAKFLRQKLIEENECLTSDLRQLVRLDMITRVIDYWSTYNDSERLGETLKFTEIRENKNFSFRIFDFTVSG